MNDQHNWYTTFFNGLALDLWNAIPLEFTEPEIKFIKGVANLKPGDHILDIPCGSGRHSIPLAMAGYSVTGIDISEANINTVRKLALENGVNVEAVKADILDYNPDKLFDLAICLGNSFSYFPSDKMCEFALKVQNALKSGAKFLINTGVLAESILLNMEPKLWYETGGLFFMIENEYLTRDSVLKSEMIFVKGERVERKTAYHFVYTLAEVRRMLKEAGFKKIDVFSGVDGTEFKKGDREAYIVAGK